MPFRDYLPRFRPNPPRGRAARRPGNYRPRLELLEDRTLPAITWSNRLTATDTFTSAERAVVDQALRHWDSLLVDFDNDPSNAPHTVNVTITGGSTSGLDLGGGILASSGSFTATAAGLPSSSQIRIDASAGGNPAGWYIDPVPGDNAEFPDLLTRHAAEGGPPGQDLYAAVLHELAHAVGFTAGYARFASRLTADPPSGATRTYTGAGGLTARFGPASGGTHLDPASHPDDLMSGAGQPGATRALPSDVDVRLLADAFGYTVALPSTRQTFLANLNLTTGVLTIHGDPQVLHDTITLDRLGANLRVSVNGITATFAPGTLTAITVLAGAGNDIINVEPTLFGLGITVDGGSGDDTIHISPIARFLDGVAGSLTIHGGTGSDSFTIHDQANPFGDTYALTPTTVSRTFAAPITYGTLETVLVNAGGGNSIITIQGTAPGTAVTVNAGAGNDTIQVSPVDNFLSHLAGNLTINGGLGFDALTLHDQVNPFGDAYTLTATTVARPSAGLLTYGTLESLTLNAGGGNSTFTISGTAAGTSVTVNAGSGNDTFHVGDATNTLDGLLGSLSVNGQGDSDVLNVADQGTAAAKTYTLGFSSVGRTGTASIFYGTVEGVAVQAGGGNDTINVTTTFLGAPVAVHAGAGQDTVVGPGGTNTWNLTAPNAGSLSGAVSFAAAENLSGGFGADTFLLPPGQGITGNLSGGGGADTLSYAAYATAVTINLATGTATGVGGSVSAVENVTGGAGNDVLRGDGAPNVLLGSGGHDLLMGGGGNDTLEGGAGRDLLIGGLLDNDHLEGGQDDDILIAGSTSHDANEALLLDILAEWTRVDQTYAQRVNNLRPFLNGSTVFNDGLPDEVFGQAGLDWFWVDSLDRTDQGADELVN
jgi:Ca2+-binding RTX toxin-like protein